ncbi:hypothetical protein G4D82_12185 [Flavobacterium sp. CYK-4]|uniref:hypothetical protein n=1 Tax=Flavobacterium lotistagni TaxID=2709660 RepID=UPI0014094937|nr:hypothetical protein [Flavobacterium lotistagni]NHM07984.1 hypothetical protein [Flavobacterium lotistagni]
MKDRPILFYAIILSILVEFLLIIVVYTSVGALRLPAQITRLTIQLILIAFIFTKKSNSALLGLAGYHIFSGLVNLAYINSSVLTKILFAYHVGIGLIIYFHDYLEEKIKSKSN